MHRWTRHREGLYFAILIVIHLVPLWGFTYFPSQDGPAHLENARIILEYNNPDRTLWREYYELNPRPVPNWSVHLILAGLMSVFPTLFAHKIFLSVYVILFPLAVRYALRSIRPEAGSLAFLAFPFVYSYLLHMGFYAFSVSLVLFFVVIGYWLRHRDGITAGRTAVLALLWVLLYFCHPVSLTMAGLAIAILAVGFTAADAGRQSRRDELNVRSLGWVLIRRIGWPLAAGLPALALLLLFLRGSGVDRIYDRKPENILRSLLKLTSLISFDAREAWFAAALVALMGLIALYLILSGGIPHRIQSSHGFLLAAVAYVLVCFLAPSQISGGSFILPRLVLYPYLMLILWFGAHAFPAIVRRAIPVAASVVALGFLGLHCLSYVALNDQLREYLSGMDRIEENTTLAPLCFSPGGVGPNGRAISYPVKPLLHASSYIATKRHVVEFANYEANTRFFPVLFRTALNPYKNVGRLDHDPPVLYPPAARGRIDYFLIWGLRPDQRTLKSVKEILAQLDDGYDLVYTSPERGLLQVYRKKEQEGSDRSDGSDP